MHLLVVVSSSSDGHADLLGGKYASHEETDFLLVVVANGVYPVFLAFLALVVLFEHPGGSVEGLPAFHLLHLVVQLGNRLLHLFWIPA